MSFDSEYLCQKKNNKIEWKGALKANVKYKNMLPNCLERD